MYPVLPQKWLVTLIGRDVVDFISGQFAVLKCTQNPCARVMGKDFLMYPHDSTGLSGG
jgi:hypothetical protein